MTDLNSFSLSFSLFMSSNILKSFAALFLPDWSSFFASGPRKLMYLSNTFFDALQILSFFFFNFQELNHSCSHHQRTDQFQIRKQ